MKLEEEKPKTTPSKYFAQPSKLHSFVASEVSTLQHGEEPKQPGAWTPRAHGQQQTQWMQCWCETTGFTWSKWGQNTGKYLLGTGCVTFLFAD